MKHVCDVCGWEYDEELGYPEGGIAPGTKWEDVPEDFVFCRQGGIFRGITIACRNEPCENAHPG